MGLVEGLSVVLVLGLYAAFVRTANRKPPRPPYIGDKPKTPTNPGP